MGWKVDGISYRRIADSLKLWRGITLYYDKAWWDKVEQSWVSETFGIIDSASIYDRERRDRQLKKVLQDPHAGLSHIKWGNLIFKSFQAGNIKKLDFDFYYEPG